MIVSAAYPEVPAPLIDELREGGRLVQPIGPGGDEDVTLFERIPGGLRQVGVANGGEFRLPLRQIRLSRIRA